MFISRLWLGFVSLFIIDVIRCDASDVPLVQRTSSDELTDVTTLEAINPNTRAVCSCTSSFNCASTNMASDMLSAAQSAIQASYSAQATSSGRVKYIADYMAARYTAQNWNAVETYDAIIYWGYYHAELYIQVDSLNWTRFLIYSS